MTEKEYSHDPHIWPITRPWRVWTDDEIKAAVVIAEQLLLEAYEGWGEWESVYEEWRVTAPPKPKPEPKPEVDADDLPDVS